MSCLSGPSAEWRDNLLTGRTGAVPLSEPQAITPILLVSAQESDRHILEAILSNSAYVLVHTPNWTAALNLAGHFVFPVILYDRHLDVVNWQSAVKRLTSSWRCPSVLLLSQVREIGLRDEVIGLGGFEVLVRPFQFGEVWRTLEAAMVPFARRRPLHNRFTRRKI